MKKLLLALVMLMPFAVHAANKSIMFEIGVGFGKSGKTSYSNKEKKNLDLSLCKNRDSGAMTFMAIRYQQDDVELHGAKWYHDTDTKSCNRDSYAIGVGYVLDTRGDGIQGTIEDKTYAKWTPGVAYTWGDNKNFKGQEEDGTNWRLHGNWQMFNRFALGTGNRSHDVEVAVHRYGTFDPNHGEYFATVGVALKDLEDNRPITPKEEPPIEEPPSEPPVEEPPVEPPVVEPPHHEPPHHDDDDHKRGDNGHGNGSEGYSPGRGHGANDDEHDD